MKRWALLMCGLLTATGCERQMHDMYDQPRYKPLAETARFADGGASRTAPEQTVPRASSAFAQSSSGVLGIDAERLRDRDATASANPYPMSAQLLMRGQQRYRIFCVPCHSEVGDGDGFVVRRGFPAPPSFHTDELRDTGDRHLFDVISDGSGIMFAFADRIEPTDRWAIVAYIRALQLSQHAPAHLLSADDDAQLRSVTP